MEAKSQDMQHRVRILTECPFALTDKMAKRKSFDIDVVHGPPY